MTFQADLKAALVAAGADTGSPLTDAFANGFAAAILTWAGGGGGGLTAPVHLTSQVDQVLPVANGGTGSASAPAGGFAGLTALATEATTRATDDSTNASAISAEASARSAADAAVTAAAAADATSKANAAQAASQPLDSDLTAIAALTTTSFGRSFLDRSDAAAGRTLLSLGTAATSATSAFDAAGSSAAAQAASQPLDSDLTAIAALATATYGRSLLTLADVPALAVEVVSSRITALDSNHLHAWEMNDASGNFVDTGSSSAKVNLTAASTPLYQTPGIAGSCALLGYDAAGANAASKASALVSAFSDLPLTNVSIECWFRSYGSTLGFLFGVDNAGSANFSVSTATASLLARTVQTTQFTSGGSTAGNLIVQPHVWQHVALVYDTAGGTVYLYVAGEVVLRATSITGNVQWSLGTTPTFQVGLGQNSAGQFRGQVSRLRLSNIARSQAYLRAVYKAGMLL